MGATRSGSRSWAGTLGQAEAEAGCDVCFDTLAPYVELELAGEGADSAIPASARTPAAARPAARSIDSLARWSAASRAL